MAPWGYNASVAFPWCLPEYSYQSICLLIHKNQQCPIGDLQLHLPWSVVFVWAVRYTHDGIAGHICRQCLADLLIFHQRLGWWGFETLQIFDSVEGNHLNWVLGATWINTAPKPSMPTTRPRRSWVTGLLPCVRACSVIGMPTCTHISL